MSFKLTYATMFDPPAELHASFDSAVARALAKLAAGMPCTLPARSAARRGTL